jgi:hypothetical protein
MGTATGREYSVIGFDPMQIKIKKEEILILIHPIRLFISRIENNNKK